MTIASMFLVFFAPGCCFEAAVTENQQVGGLTGRRKQKKKDEKKEICERSRN